ncbi:TetR/AcrR family transcriptional regulator [Limimaricola pyoseonensis]|uniref:DNA-binding transcriptional regulator, AcrR family n=1 Tax=Limimaricola pyoseonensis TaxID=521013 RepID=A0A1G7DFF3_9RHOB|nr:TetR/AcrR family transcriptional regulator [Limimaricola pyoseonensis]SDE50243.1 DNA-binding transcriptional regulator, AcrR family [Limimaricola pyoseonensis]
MLDTRRDTKAEIGAAALRLFAERGYAAVSVRDIAERVGIRPSAIYNHFPGKQDILVGLLESHMERLLAALARGVPGTGDPAARLDAFVRLHVGYHIRRPDEVFIAYMELRSLEPENLARIKTLRRRYEAALRAILEDGRATGRFAIDEPFVATMGLIAQITGVTNWYREGGRLGEAEVVELYVTQARRAVGAAMPQTQDREDTCSTDR